jgi:hypothetical protein
MVKSEYRAVSDNVLGVSSQTESSVVAQLILPSKTLMRDRTSRCLRLEWSGEGQSNYTAFIFTVTNTIRNLLQHKAANVR